MSLLTTVPPRHPRARGDGLTRIEAGAAYETSVTFLHTLASHHDAVVSAAVHTAEALTTAPGYRAVNVLSSIDASRVVVYAQWEDSAHVSSAHERISQIAVGTGALTADTRPRSYEVVYADDRSAEGVSVISPEYSGAIFINEITTRPETQRRLLELVIANNEIQSQSTPGYRSANFHRSIDGERAVNYSLWESVDGAITAISAMADMDENLEETLQLAEPDFRFYTLVFAASA
jgi:heme-degrading monooxygenase HmoA